MRISRFLFALTMLVLLGGFSFVAQAAEGNIKIKSTTEMEVVTVDKDGKKTVKRTPVEKAVPGTEVIFTNTFENIGKKIATDIVVTNPVPNDMVYKGGSVFGRDCLVIFSVDGGKTYGAAENLKVKDENGKNQPALPKDYTNIRWTFKAHLANGKSSEVGFRAVIK